MGDDIDKYFALFPGLTDPNRLRDIRRSAQVRSSPAGIAVSLIKPLPEDAPQYAQIGKIAVEWAKLEADIDEVVWRLSGAHPHLIACLTAQMIGPGPRLRALEAMCRVASLDEAADQLAKFSRHALGVAEQRNRFVHDPWHVLSDELTGESLLKKEVTAKGRLKIEEKPISDAEFERIIYKIRVLTDIFDHLTFSLIFNTHLAKGGP